MSPTDPPPGLRADDEALHTLLARARAQAGRDPAGALALLDSSGRDDALLHHARGTLLVRLGRFDDAVAALERAVSLQPEVVDFAANLGAALLQLARSRSGDAQRNIVLRARDLLADAVQQQPVFPDAGAALILVHQLLGDTDAALAAADANLRRFPEDIPTWFNRASALKAAGRIDDAAAVLQRLVQRHPEFTPAHDALLRLRN
jgi:tetratricopeptide (TPR) repeat protein